MIVSAGVDRTPGYERTLIYRAVDFFKRSVYQLCSGELIHLDAPSDASVAVHRDWILIEVRTDWNHPSGFYRAGSPCWRPTTSNSSTAQRNGDGIRADEHTCLHQYAWTRDRLVMVTLTDVASRVDIVTPRTWTRTPRGLEPNSNTAIVTADHRR